MQSTIEVEVVFANPKRQWICKVLVKQGSCVQQAIEASHILEKCPEIDFKINKVGIFGCIVSLDTQLQDKDRIEIYRPLITDPKEWRQKRVIGNR